MVNKLICCTLKYVHVHMLKSMKIVNIYTSYQILFLTYLTSYKILFIIVDSMVPVLCNEVLKFRFYMYLKEGLNTGTFYAQYLIYFL